MFIKWFLLQRITEYPRWEGSSSILCSSRITYTRLFRVVSSLELNISKDGYFTANMGNLSGALFDYHHSSENFFHTLRQNFLLFSLYSLLLVLSLGITLYSLAP